MKWFIPRVKGVPNKNILATFSKWISSQLKLKWKLMLILVCNVCLYLHKGKKHKLLDWKLGVFCDYIFDRVKAAVNREKNFLWDVRCLYYDDNMMCLADLSIILLIMQFCRQHHHLIFNITVFDVILFMTWSCTRILLIYRFTGNPFQKGLPGFSQQLHD